MKWQRRAMILMITLGLLGLSTAGCSSAPETDDGEMVERPHLDVEETPEGYEAVEIVGVFASPQGSLVMLSTEGDERMLPIFISPGQAFAIELGLQGETFDRPLTHDLVANILDDVETRLEKVHVSDFREGTFFATLYLTTPETILEIDARPSDGIAMAARDGLPIYVADHVLEEAGLSPDDMPQMPPEEPGDPDQFRDSPTQTTQLQRGY